VIVDSTPSRVAVVPDISDEVLIEQVGEGKRDALSELLRRHMRTVRSIGFRILRDEGEAEDLVQEVFFFVFRRAHLFRTSTSTATSWLIHLSYHRAIDRRRFLKTRGFYSSERLEEASTSYSSNSAIPPYHNPLEEALGRRYLDRIHSELTPEQRDTIHLFFYEGCTLKEIARHMRIPVMNVRSHFYRGLERMRRGVYTRSESGREEPR